MELGTHYRGCRHLLGLGPFEWSGIYSCFDLHVTTSFHESIFCLKQGVPVFTLEGSPERYDHHTWTSKAYFLHEEYDLLEQHYFNPYRNGTTAESVSSQIVRSWQRFDADAARQRARDLGDRYLGVAESLHRSLPGVIAHNE